MSTRRARNQVVPAQPPLLARITHAARYAPYSPLSRAGHDAALEALGQWALLRVISEGVLAPDNQPAYKAIQDVASRHLGFAKARQAFTTALSLVEPLVKRDEIETAQNELQSVSDDAYYYAGLACGVTLAHLSEDPCVHVTGRVVHRHRFMRAERANGVIRSYAR